MQTIFVHLADGFEEIEALTVVDVLRRANLPVVTVSIGSTLQVTGAHKISVVADQMFKEVDYSLGSMIILPGGMGTMDELFEMLTWNNLGIHEKKVVVLNTNGFYNTLFQLLDTMDSQGFMYDNWRSRLIVCDTVQEIMDALNEASE